MNFTTNRGSGRSFTLMTGVAFGALLIAQPAFAQDANQAGAQNPPSPESARDPAATGPQGVVPEVVPEEDIVVTGIRGSLERSISIKRNQSGVVDAISAEDMGKFPDSNLAESLQRITGVSIDRNNGVGSQVTIRGFGPTYNLTTLNGRTLATPGGETRSFNYDNLSSEGVKTLEVYKTGRAAIPSGGIGGTINIVTRRPLDGRAGLSGTVGAKAAYDTSTKGCLDCGSKITPELSGMANWVDPTNRFGVSVFGSFQRRNFTEVGANGGDWNVQSYSDFVAGNFIRDHTVCPNSTPAPTCTVVKNAPKDPNQLVGVSNQSAYSYMEGRTERLNGQAVIQFRPTDTLTLTADGLFAQYKQSATGSAIANWFNRPFDVIEFDSGPVPTAIYMHEVVNGVKDMNFGGTASTASRARIQDYGLNAKWDIADNFTMNLDGHISKSSTRPDGVDGFSSINVDIGAVAVASHSTNFSGNIPQIITTFGPRPGVPGAPGNNTLELGDVGAENLNISKNYLDQTVKEARVDFSWNLGGESHFDFGGSYRAADMRDYGQSMHQTLGNYGVAHPGDIESVAPGSLQPFCLACKFKSFDPGNGPGNQLSFFDNPATYYSAISDYYLKNNGTPGFTGTIFDPASIYDFRVKENVWAAYGQVTWNGDLGSMPASMVAGVRYEHTRSTSEGLSSVPVGSFWDSDNDFRFVASSGQQFTVGSNTYNNLLPSLDFKIEPMHNLIARVSFSKTIARPTYLDMRANVNVGPPQGPTFSGRRPSGTAGNPELDPLSSDNFDVSLEYYFKRDSYVSIGFFDKRVHNFIGIGQVTRPEFGLRDPSSGAAGTRSGAAVKALNGLADTSDENLFVMTALIDKLGSADAAKAEFASHYNTATRSLDQNYADAISNGGNAANGFPNIRNSDVQANSSDPLYQFDITLPDNNQDARLWGLEIAGQYFFGSTGVGVSASYTMVRGNIGFDNLANPEENQFALIGLSDSINAALIYDKNGLSGRLTYNWRGKYLSGINRGASHNPTYVAPFTTVDANISYNVTSNISVSLEAINIFNETSRSYARSEQQLWEANENARRIFLGARYKF
jgi:TonB-dependent receptor